MTIRQKLEGFIYPFLERYTDMLYKGGEDTVFHGVRVLDDECKFVHGALVNAAATLYAYYVKVNDERANEVLRRLEYFIKIAASNVCLTWGKLAILRGFATLEENGLIDKVNKELVDLVKEKTNYEDFFDKEKMDTRGMATNYLQVAMACAALRERFGWENDGYALKIKDKLAKALSETTAGGWLDDEMPYGRFDRYSIVLSAEFADTARITGLEVPTFIKENLRRSTELMLFIANNEGNGVCYGRSVSIHGDNAPCEVLTTAFAEGLIKESERDLALSYISAIYDKTFRFWYNEEKDCFDMWFGGRGHDPYRPFERILETNLDKINHFYMELHNLEIAGVCDVEFDETITVPECWQMKNERFIDRENDKKCTVMLKRKNRLVMLPFVGFGNSYGVHSAYMPYPAVAGGVVEGAPQGDYAYFIPEYEDKDGNKYLPAQYFDKVECTEGTDTVTVYAEGYLARRIKKGVAPSDMRFRATYKFVGADVSATFEVDCDLTCARMIAGISKFGVEYKVFGFAEERELMTEGDVKYSTTHGPISNVKEYTATDTKALGYSFTI